MVYGNIPLRSLISRRRRFQAHFGPGKPVVLQARRRRSPQALGSGHWPASFGNTEAASKFGMPFCRYGL